MSTWISSRARGALLSGLLLALGACDGLQFGMAPASMSVADGTVVVAGPPGFCVDNRESHTGTNGAFVLFGSCDSISGNLSAGRPAVRAVLTAAVSAGAQGGSIIGAESQLAAFFQSATGRKVMSRSGNPATVRVLGTSHTDGIMVLHVRDTSPFPGQAVSPDYWRALFDLNGHIVTLSVIGISDVPISDAQALATLRAFVARVRAASPSGA